MSTPDITALQYPIGKFSFKDDMTPEKRKKCILEIESTPAKLRDAVKGLTDEQLLTDLKDGQLDRLYIIFRTAILMPM